MKRIIPAVLIAFGLSGCGSQDDLFEKVNNHSNLFPYIGDKKTLEVKKESLVKYDDNKVIKGICGWASYVNMSGKQVYGRFVFYLEPVVLGLVENNGMMSGVDPELIKQYKQAFDEDWKNCKS